MTMRLLLYREALLYDIGNYAYIAGHRLELSSDTSGPASAHIITDVCADGNVDRVSRVLALAYAEVIDMLAPYLCAMPLPDIADNAVWAPDCYVVELRESAAIGAAKQQLLRHLIHEYMVCRAVADWLRLSYPSYAHEWDDRAADAASHLHSQLNSSYPYRRPLPVI